MKMKIAGKVNKAGRYWAVEIPALRIYTQGTSRSDALDMGLDAVQLHAEELEVDIPLGVDPGSENDFYIVSDDVPGLLAFIMRRQRQKAGLSVRDAAKRLGATSPTAYARYERGIVEPGFSKVNALIGAVAPGSSLVISVRGDTRTPKNAKRDASAGRPLPVNILSIPGGASFRQPATGRFSPAIDERGAPRPKISVSRQATTGKRKKTKEPPKTTPLSSKR
jgi:transcriptional regulator with XRE-family HTH domain/predicted RNase H-like HicB family nuclease